MIAKLKYLHALLVIAFIAACSTIPNTYNEKLAVAYSTLASIRQTTITLLKAGQLNVKQAKKIQASADSARSLLDMSTEFFKGGDTLSAAQKLEVAQKILDELTMKLQEKEVSP